MIQPMKMWIKKTDIWGKHTGHPSMMWKFNSWITCWKCSCNTLMTWDTSNMLMMLDSGNMLMTLDSSNMLMTLDSSNMLNDARYTSNTLMTLDNRNSQVNDERHTKNSCIKLLSLSNIFYIAQVSSLELGRLKCKKKILKSKKRIIWVWMINKSPIMTPKLIYFT